MTSPTILVVLMRSDTDGPNRFPGKSRLTLFRSNTGMPSAVVGAWRGSLAGRGPGGAAAGGALGVRGRRLVAKASVEDARRLLVDSCDRLDTLTQLKFIN